MWNIVVFILKNVNYIDTLILDGELTDKVNDPSSSCESSSSGASTDYSQNRTGHNYKRSTSPAFSLGSQGRSMDTGESSDSSRSTVDYSKQGEGQGSLHYIT